MNYNKLVDFSAKDSKEYNDSMKLFEEAGDSSSNALANFNDTLYCKGKIPTHLRQKSHNSEHFLDEDYLSSRKMNADTSAIKELTENLMYGSTEEDLEKEITEGGVAEEVAQVFANHGITGDAVKDTFKKLETYYGTDPNTAQLSNESSDEEEGDEVSDEDVEDFGDEGEAAYEDDSGDTDELADEGDDENMEESLEEKYIRVRKALLENKLKKVVNKWS